MTEFDALVRIMQRLREPRGCPWDREQTHDTLKPYLLEECYELLEAVDQQDPEAMCGELGDVLLQVVFHARLAQEAGRFDVRDVCRRINDKLVHRHPHVFGDVHVSNSDEVLYNWDRLKADEAEAANRQSVLDGTPKALPALMRATDLQKKASKVGFDWDSVDGARAKVHEEEAELDHALQTGDQEAIAHELGDLLFSIVNVARFLKVDSEDALRLACNRFTQRFQAIEKQAAEAGRSLQDMTLAEMDELWEAAKNA